MDSVNLASDGLCGSTICSVEQLVFSGDFERGKIFLIDFCMLKRGPVVELVTKLFGVLDFRELKNEIIGTESLDPGGTSNNSVLSIHLLRVVSNGAISKPEAVVIFTGSL